MKRTVFALAAAVIAAGGVYLALQKRETQPTSPSEEVTAPAPAPVVAAPAPVPRENFDTVQDSLPTVDRIAAHSAEELHNTPPELIDAGRKIGELVKAVQQDPSREPEALEFYGKCARREELPLSTRAHCLHNLRELSKKRGEKANEDGISANVLKLEG